MTPVEILKAARKLISEPTSWAKEFYAFSLPNTFGDHIVYEADSVSVDDPIAKCFCSIGALAKVKGLSGIEVSCSNFPEVIALADVIPNAHMHHNYYPGAIVANFNDNSSHEEVLAMFDKAIEKLSKE